MAHERTQLPQSDVTKKIIRVDYHAGNERAHGFLESVDANCMHRALMRAGFSGQRKVSIPVLLRGWDAGLFNADLVVSGLILVQVKAVQVKAVQNLDRSHEAQGMNYLRATGLELGLLLNFGEFKPRFREIVFENVNKLRVRPRESAVRGSSQECA
jgi:GxxExxY protein